MPDKQKFYIAKEKIMAIGKFKSLHEEDSDESAVVFSIYDENAFEDILSCLDQYDIFNKICTGENEGNRFNVYHSKNSSIIVSSKKSYTVDFAQLKIIGDLGVDGRVEVQECIDNLGNHLRDSVLNNKRIKKELGFYALGAYNRLNIQEKIGFLENILARGEKKFTCGSCDDFIPNGDNLCKLCNYLYQPKPFIVTETVNQINEEIQLLKEDEDFMTLKMNQEVFS